MTPSRWVDDANAALLTDLYELTMLQAYWKEKMTEEAVFSLFTRKLPSNRNYLITAGLDDVLHFLENCTFPQDYLDYLNTQGLFSEDFLDRLSRFRFEGDVYAMPEGTPFFADEPVLEVVAPIFQAQLVETFAMNQIHFQSVLASKASRVAFAARGGKVVDFGLRRMSGTDAGLKSARAFHIAGVNATSNVLAGYVYGAAITGTMAHSYIQAHDTEMDAFRAFARLYPSTVLLVDTYDTLEGVRKVVRLAEELGEGFTVRGIRLDSGDLAELAVQSREILDAAGLTEVSIFVSGSLDEFAIAEIVAKDVPVSGFGVGTKMGVSEDNPSLDMAYKLTAYAGKGRLKTSSGKRILPGKKQVFRVEEHGRAAYDILAGEEESHPGRPLLRKVMERGKRLPDGRVGLDESRDLCRKELEAMPERIRAIAPAEPPYEVRISPELKRKQSEVIARVESESA
ncbi:MAG: nicotinate phosphoribosyltransferase [Desulfovibrionales bacterium]